MSLPDIYLLYGWKAGFTELKAALMTLGEVAQAEGIQVVFSRDGKASFIGKVLVCVNAAEGLVFGDVPAPTPAEGDALKASMVRMKLTGTAKGDPRMWVVVG